jgi:GrpB-like predicted nucleotidyltransferase (UPF0157 family)
MLPPVIEPDEPIEVVAHDPAWLDLGRELVREIAERLCALRAEVAHIGSTAVPGLAAKPIIDIQVGSSRNTDEVITHLQQIGFEHMGQTGGPGREYLRRRIGQPANIAVVELGGPLWADNLMFRDYLSAHPDAATRYARAKLLAAEETGALRAYSELKSATVTEIMDEARAGRR